MFIGKYYNSIDAKNRMIVPQKHRNELGAGCIITRGFDKCLYIYKVEDWEKQAEKFDQLPEADPKVRDFIESFFGNAQDCEFDSQGRIIIPNHLKEFAEIKKELVTLGARKRIDVYAKEVFEKPKDKQRVEGAMSFDALIEYNL